MILLDIYVNILCHPLKFAKFKYDFNFMLIYAKIFKLSHHLDI